MEATAIGGALLRNVASFVSARLGERRQERRAAAGRLRAVVMEVLAHIDATDAHPVLSQHRVRLEAAIREVQTLSTGRARTRLDAAVLQYRACRDAI